jgi:hypothetical protein
VEKRLFLDISSTNIDTLVPSLYQCVKTRSLEVLWLLSHPHPYIPFSHFVISEAFGTFLDLSCELLYSTNPSHGKHKNISL